MEKPFAITLDVGSSRANKTGSWRTERPVYVDRAGALRRRLPGRARTSRRWLYHAEEGELRARVAADHGRTTRFPR